MVFGNKDGGDDAADNAGAMSLRFMTSIRETLGDTKDAKRTAGTNDVTEFNILCTPGLVSTEFIKERMKQAMKSDGVETLVLDDFVDRNDDEVNKAFVEFMKKDTRAWTAIKMMSTIDVTEFHDYYKKKERLVDALNSQTLKKLRLPIKIRVKVHIGPEQDKDRPAYKMIKDLLRDRRLHFIRAYQQENNSEVKKLNSLLAPGVDGERRAVTMFISFWGPKKNKPDYESWHPSLRLMLSQLKGVDDTTFEDYEEVFERDNDVVKLNDDLLEELMALDADASDYDEDDFDDEPPHGRMGHSSKSHMRALDSSASSHGRRTSTLRRGSSFPPREQGGRQGMLQKAASKARLSSRQLGTGGGNGSKRKSSPPREQGGRQQLLQKAASKARLSSRQLDNGGSQTKRGSSLARPTAPSKRNPREDRPGIMKIMSSSNMNNSDRSSNHRRSAASNRTTTTNTSNNKRILKSQSSRKLMKDTSAGSHTTASSSRRTARGGRHSGMELMDSVSEHSHRSGSDRRSVSMGVESGKLSGSRPSKRSASNQRNDHLPSMDYSHNDRNLQRASSRQGPLVRRSAPPTAPRKQPPPPPQKASSVSSRSSRNRMPRPTGSRPSISPIREQRNSRSPVSEEQVGTYRQKGKVYRRSTGNQTPSNIFAALEATNRTGGSASSDNDRDETSQRIMSALLATNIT